MSRTVTREAVIIRLAAAVRKAGGLRPLGREWKLSAAYLSDVIRGHRPPGPAILKRFGLVARRDATVTYERPSMASSSSKRR